MTAMTASLDAARRVLEALLQGAAVVGFEYRAGFRLFLERARPDPALADVPLALVLDLRGHWGPAAATVPAQAQALATWIGATITAVRATDRGCLHVTGDHGASLHVLAGDAGWEDAWSVYPPPNVPGAERWSVVCDQDGSLHVVVPPELHSRLVTEPQLEAAAC